MQKFFVPFRSSAKIAAIAGFFAAGAFALPANATVYMIDRTIGATGAVTGYIETDGTVGAIQTENLVDWTLTLTIDDSSVELFGPLSGDNSVGSIIGAGLTASETQLSVTGGAGNFFQFCMEAPSYPDVCNLGLESWYVSTSTLFYEQVRGIPGETPQDSGLQGAFGDIFVIGLADAGPPVSDVPLPAGAWLFLTGAAGAFGLRRKRKTR